jgi:hypothetical protein
VTKLVNILRWTVLCLLGLAVVFYLLLLAINWRDEPPSMAAQELRRLFEQRPPVRDDDNAYIYLLGFSAPAGRSPQDAGAVIRDWIESVNRDPSRYKPMPDLQSDVDSDASAPTLKRLREECPRDQPLQCRDLFEELAHGAPFTKAELHLLSRYAELRARRQWREVVPTDLRLPLPAYSNVMRAQSLYLLELRRLAATGAALEVRAGLQNDLEFWREAHVSSDTLISRMISVAALRQHFFFGNLALRILPRDSQSMAIPESWLRPLGPAEFDVLRVMAGELQFAQGTLSKVLDPPYWRSVDDLESDESWGDRLVVWLADPLYQQQDVINQMAEDYSSFARSFRVPLTQYVALESELKSRQPASAWSFRNPIGRWISAQSGMDVFASYPVRSASVEGMRRAAVLTAQLRAAQVTPEKLQEQVLASPLRNPFDDKPFVWNAEHAAVEYRGPDNQLVKTHVYFH